jgi:hypothetical protein
MNQELRCPCKKFYSSPLFDNYCSVCYKSTDTYQILNGIKELSLIPRGKNNKLALLTQKRTNDSIEFTSK